MKEAFAGVIKTKKVSLVLYLGFLHKPVLRPPKDKPGVFQASLALLPWLVDSPAPCPLISSP